MIYKDTFALTFRYKSGFKALQVGDSVVAVVFSFVHCLLRFCVCFLFCNAINVVFSSILQSSQTRELFDLL